MSDTYSRVEAPLAPGAGTAISPEGELNEATVPKPSTNMFTELPLPASVLTAPDTMSHTLTLWFAVSQMYSGLKLVVLKGSTAMAEGEENWAKRGDKVLST